MQSLERQEKKLLNKFVLFFAMIYSGTMDEIVKKQHHQRFFFSLLFLSVAIYVNILSSLDGAERSTLFIKIIVSERKRKTASHTSQWDWKCIQYMYQQLPFAVEFRTHSKWLNAMKQMRRYDISENVCNLKLLRGFYTYIKHAFSNMSRQLEFFFSAAAASFSFWLL